MNNSSPTAEDIGRFDPNTHLGSWTPDDPSASPKKISFEEACRYIKRPIFMVEGEEGVVPETSGSLSIGGLAPGANSIPLHAYTPPCAIERLGSAEFCSDYSIRYPLLGGSMAKGISSAAIVEEMARAGMLGFFGAAGLPLEKIEAAIDRLQGNLGDLPFGFNLIHSPQEPDLEEALVDLYIRRGVRLIEASAFLALTLPVVRYRVAGIHRDASGCIIAPNRIVAKISREEVAAKFFAPPPQKLLRKLVERGDITAEEAELASSIPMAQDVTAEADSGGHTDNRPAMALFPTIVSLKNRMQKEHGYEKELRVGLSGGIATPVSAAAAFAMGAAYLMTGSVNQACVESGTSDEVRGMLAETRQADVALAPAADMFEMGVTVQVLKRGTMFPMRAWKLYEIYRSCQSIDEIPAAERTKLEATLFKAPLSEIWDQTRAFFERRDPRQVERALRDPKHLMALVFRWYLGQAAHWANDGLSIRKVDYQIWCGPGMGAFNEWTRGSFLEKPENRKVAVVCLNILFGAAVITRIGSLRLQGLSLPAETDQIEPLELAQIEEYLR